MFVRASNGGGGGNENSVWDYNKTLPSKINCSFKPKYVMIVGTYQSKVLVDVYRSDNSTTTHDSVYDGTLYPNIAMHAATGMIEDIVDDGVVIRSNMSGGSVTHAYWIVST